MEKVKPQEKPMCLINEAPRSEDVLDDTDVQLNALFT
jgi:hypothetical protein